MEPGLIDTPLEHHEPGNEYCAFCYRIDGAYPRHCRCGGLVHGEVDESLGADNSRFIEVCDGCGAPEEERSAG